jgi:hypothetical protein
MNLKASSLNFAATISLLLFVNVAAQSAEPITDLSDALAAGKETSKPIFVYVFDSV